MVLKTTPTTSKVKVLGAFVLGPAEIAEVGTEVELSPGMAQLCITAGAAEAVEEEAPAKHDPEIQNRDPQPATHDPKAALKHGHK